MKGTPIKSIDVIIIGAGASGLMCAIEAGKRRKVLVIDHAEKPGKKILMSGGGRCNFTNVEVSAEHYISHNPHFCKSALSHYSQWDFLQLVQKHRITYHERDHGQLFCDNSSHDILDMLLSECKQAGETFLFGTKIERIEQRGERQFHILTNRGSYICRSLVVATGGLSIPAGASPLGYQIAEQFGIKVWPPRAGLVPFTLQLKDKASLSTLSGIAVDAVIGNQSIAFRENLLFTHRGLSGPTALQLSSYWQPGEELVINLLPEIELVEVLMKRQIDHPRQMAKSVLAEYLPKRLVAAMVPAELGEQPLKSLSISQMEKIAAHLQSWRIKPGGTEGYRTAEVTCGGVDCDAVSSKTMETLRVPGLFFIGEVLDVTGQLGGYNLQWAWSSGWCAGQVV